MIDYALIIGVVSTGAAAVAAYYAYKAYITNNSPKLVVEAPFNSSLQLRNVGTDAAKNIKEPTGMFRDMPSEIWNFTGPIDYLRVKSPGISRQIDFHDEKRIKPSDSSIVRFEYENSDGTRFFSEIKVERGPATQQLWFATPVLVNWGKC
ncbi:hypothetical protein HYV30_01425 [Candidatus Kaiserbacteria bacterium]|nr:hypothetical protein [Candidatus Kaiserbacteria bacterium]